MSSQSRMTRCISAFILFSVLIAANAQDTASVAVTTVALGELLIRPEISAPATVESLADSRISAELNAVIRAVPVRVGTTVAAGDTLVQFDCTDYDLHAQELQARLAATTARAGFARQQLARARKLQSSRTMSQEVLEQREAELASLAAEADAQQAMLAQNSRERDKCTLTAPFRAVVLEQLAHVGEYAMPATPLLRILALDQLEIAAAVISTDAAPLESAERIVFRHDGRDYPLRLRTLTPVIDPLTRSRQARLLFSGEPALPGAAGRLVWYQPPSLPADLLVRRQGRLGVLLAEQDRARFHVLTGAHEGRPAALDLPPQTRVITDGRFAVSDGDRISIATPAAVAGGAPEAPADDVSDAARIVPDQPPAATGQPSSPEQAEPVLGEIGS